MRNRGKALPAVSFISTAETRAAFSSVYRIVISRDSSDMIFDAIGLCLGVVREQGAAQRRAGRDQAGAVVDRAWVRWCLSANRSLIQFSSMAEQLRA